MPPKKPSPATLVPAVIESRIHVVRGQRVMLDSDIAGLYGVPTRAVNQAIDRNAGRFPQDFAFQLTPHEFTDLMSQIVTSSSGHGGRRKLPWVFTEHGIAMLASVLRSEQAARVNIEIIRAFVRLRRLLATPGELAAQLLKLADMVQDHDHQIRAIADVLQQMMAPPPPAPPTRKIGFVDTENQP